jgi:hypothetical protein
MKHPHEKHHPVDIAKWVRQIEEGISVPLGTEAAIFFRERERLQKEKECQRVNI